MFPKWMRRERRNAPRCEETDFHAREKKILCVPVSQSRQLRINTEHTYLFTNACVRVAKIQRAITLLIAPPQIGSSHHVLNPLPLGTKSIPTTPTTKVGIASTKAPRKSLVSWEVSRCCISREREERLGGV